LNSTTKKKNRKLKLKFTSFYKVTQVIKQKSCDLNIKISNFNLNIKRVSIKKLKIVKLHFKMIKDLLLEI